MDSVDFMIGVSIISGITTKLIVDTFPDIEFIDASGIFIGIIGIGLTIIALKR